MTFVVHSISIAMATLFLTASFALSTCWAKSNLVDRPKRDLLHVSGIDGLAPGNQELAEQLEIWPMLLELYDKEKPSTRERKIVLLHKIRETILESYFDAMSIQAEAEREQGNLEALRELLTAKRDRAIELNNAGNFIGSGTLNTIGSVLGFSGTTPPLSGNLNQMLSGVVSAGMSSYALKQSTGGKTTGEGKPTIIAELFGRPTDERTAYPESVWRFFHSKSIEQPGMTRAQVMEERWIERRRLEKHGSPRESLKIDLVSGVAVSKKCMTLDDLSDQIYMISDVAGLASLMTHHLRDLLRMIDSDVLELDSVTN